MCRSHRCERPMDGHASSRRLATSATRRSRSTSARRRASSAVSFDQSVGPWRSLDSSSRLTMQQPHVARDRHVLEAPPLQAARGPCATSTSAALAQCRGTSSARGSPSSRRGPCPHPRCTGLPLRCPIRRVHHVRTTHDLRVSDSVAHVRPPSASTPYHGDGVGGFRRLAPLQHARGDGTRPAVRHAVVAFVRGEPCHPRRPARRIGRKAKSPRAQVARWWRAASRSRRASSPRPSFVAGADAHVLSPSRSSSAARSLATSAALSSRPRWSARNTPG